MKKKSQAICIMGRRKDANAAQALTDSFFPNFQHNVSRFGKGLPTKK